MAIINGDCLEVMRGMGPDSVDLVLVDPPYCGVKRASWDRQWNTATAFLSWIGLLCAEWQRILKPNGSVYCFASPAMSARVECVVADYFTVLNRITWNKANLRVGGRHKAACKASLRSFFPASEAIIFAEHLGADSMAKGEPGYQRKCDELRGFVFEPLRAYFDSERMRCGMSTDEIADWFGGRGYPRWVTARHTFTRSQWALPTKENYARLRECFRERGLSEPLRREYDDLRREYEDLRRPFAVTDDVPYTDVWEFETVPARSGKHECEKPVAMLRHMISAATRPGAVVLDCCMGSGSTGVACAEVGREFIGVEVSKHWCSVAARRIAEVGAQGSLFGEALP